MIVSPIGQIPSIASSRPEAEPMPQSIPRTNRVWRRLRLVRSRVTSPTPVALHSPARAELKRRAPER